MGRGDAPYLRYLMEEKTPIIEDLRGLVAQPSVSAENIGMEECAELLAQMMRRAGIEARIYRTPGFPIVHGEVRGEDARRTILVYGHYDVQPVDPIGEWRFDPFAARVEGNRLYGRGAADNKGQFFTQVKAVEVLLATAGTCPVNVKFLFEGEEEVGSPNLARFVEDHRDLVAADTFFRSDGNKHESGLPLVKLGQKGMLYLELSTVAGSRDLHSSRSTVAVNPVWRLIDALTSMYDRQGWRVSIDGFYDRVQPVTSKDREFISSIPFSQEKVEADMGRKVRPGLDDGSEYYEAFLLTPHLTVSGIHAGYGGSGVKTIVPREASAKLDFRLVPQQDPESIERLVRRHLDALGLADINVKVLAKIRPARTPSDHPYVGRVIDSLRSIYGSEPVVYPSSEGSGPAYIFREILSLPMVIVPCAQFDCNMHAPNENIEVDGMMRGIELFIDLMYRESRVVDGAQGRDSQ